jgi:hypothetical protein
MTPIKLIEQRLEITKHLGNAQLSYLQRLYDGRFVWERYLESEIWVHVHCGLPRPICLTCRREPSDMTGLFLYKNETLMLVEVGEVADQFQTLPARIRLTQVEQCDMFIANSFKLSLSPTLEDLWEVFNRKLDSIAHASDVLLRDGTGGVIERTPKAIRELTNTNADFSSDDIERFLQDYKIGMNIRIGRDIALTGTRRESFDIRQVFVCPIEQGLNLIARD